MPETYDHRDQRRFHAMKTCDMQALERGYDLRPDQPEEEFNRFVFFGLAGLVIFGLFCLMCAVR